MLQNERYIRQMILPGFGLVSQDKLRSAKVLIVGMGGLGCPALQYLVAAGVGKIGIMDADQVSASNLHRQLLFNASEIGQNKVVVAAVKMNQLDNAVLIDSYPFALNKQNAPEIIKNYDLVIDGTDNFSAKYLINDACVLLNKPWVYGAVSRYQGQLCVFNLAEQDTPAINYRDLFPVAPGSGEIKTCEETGVIGVLPGIIGTMQAAEAIKLITGLGKLIYGRLFNYDLLRAGSYEIAIAKQDNPLMIDRDFFESMNYVEDCVMEADGIEEINVATFNSLRTNPNVFVLDVRERHEYPAIDFSDAQIPMSELQDSIAKLPEKEICIICHQGIRSVYAARLIKSQRHVRVYSLKGGLTAYFKEAL